MGLNRLDKKSEKGLLTMLVKLTNAEAELAARKYYLVNDFLEMRNLDCEKFYDAALDGFLKAVKSCFTDTNSLSFEEIALKEMQLSCTQVLSDYEEDDGIVCSIEDCLVNGLPIEKAVADTIDIAREVINSISFEETMQGFDMNERRIAELLLSGYTERSIAEMLDMNLFSVFRNIESICNKLSGAALAAAA